MVSNPSILAEPKIMPEKKKTRREYFVQKKQEIKQKMNTDEILMYSVGKRCGIHSTRARMGS